MKIHWIGELWCYVIFQKCEILQCIFHLNHLVNTNLFYTCNEQVIVVPILIRWCNIWLGIFIHSDLSLMPLLSNDFSLFPTTTFAWMQILCYSVLIVKNLNTETRCLNSSVGRQCASQWHFPFLVNHMSLARGTSVWFWDNLIIWEKSWNIISNCPATKELLRCHFHYAIYFYFRYLQQPSQAWQMTEKNNMWMFFLKEIYIWK